MFRRPSKTTLIVLCLALLGFCILCAIQLPSYYYFRTREMTIQAFQRMRVIAVELDDIEPDNWPSSLTELPIKEPETQDPFTGGEFVFFSSTTPQGRAWCLVCAGPNGKSGFQTPDAIYMPYDPTNGTKSTGDILFTHNFIPDIEPNSRFYRDILEGRYRTGEWEATVYGFRRKGRTRAEESKSGSE
ncbi:hypothetical protein ACFL34_02160 [Candidatus Sumerlaeota bacterium]